MRADDDLRLAGPDLPVNMFFICDALFPRKKHGVNLQLFGPVFYIAVMLFGQYLRRRHHSRLVTVTAYSRHGGHGDHRFAASYITLDKSVHGAGFGHVPFYLAYDPPLGSG